MKKWKVVRKIIAEITIFSFVMLSMATAFLPAVQAETNTTVQQSTVASSTESGSIDGTKAVPGPNKSTYKGFNVNLDGSKSISGQGTELNYLWKLVAKPLGSQSFIAKSDNVNAGFLPDVVGTYLISLVVTDSEGNTDQKQISVSVKDFSDAADDVNYELIDSLNPSFISGYSFGDWVTLSDGWMIIGDTNKNKVIILNPVTGEIGKEYQLTASPIRIDFDFEKGIVFAALKERNTIVKIDVNKDQITYIPTSGNNIEVVIGDNNIVFSLFSVWPGSRVSIIDAAQNKELSVYTINEKVNYMVFDKNLSNLILGESATSPSSLLRCSYDKANQKLNLEQNIWDMGGNGQDLTISNDGKHIAFCCGGGNGSGYTIFDIDSSNLTKTFGEWNTDAYPKSAFFSNDNRYLVATNCFDIKVFDVKLHTLLETITKSSYPSYGSITKVGMSRGNRIIYGYDGSNIYWYKFKAYVPPAAVNSLVPDKKGPFYPNIPVTFLCNATGGEALQYQFEIFTQSTGWQIKQGYSSDNRFVWTPTMPGEYIVQAKVRSGNSTEDYDDCKQIKIFVVSTWDLQKPVVKIKTPVKDMVYTQNNYTITGQVIDNDKLNEKTVKLFINERLEATNQFISDFSFDVELPNGRNIIRVEAVDSSGNRSLPDYRLDTRMIAIDTIAPAIEINEAAIDEMDISPIDGIQTKEKKISIIGKVYDDLSPSKDIRVMVNNVKARVLDDGNFNAVLTLKEGTNNIVITAKDKVGRTTTSKSYIVTMLETKKPVIKIMNPAKNVLSNTEGLYSLEGTINEQAVVSVYLKTNDEVEKKVYETLTPDTGFLCDINLQAGVNTLRVEAIDLADNRSAPTPGKDTRIITIDTEPPVLSDVLVNEQPVLNDTVAVSSSKLIIKGTISDNISTSATAFTVMINGRKATVTPKLTFMYTLIRTKGQTSIPISIKDKAGNEYQSQINLDLPLSS